MADRYLSAQTLRLQFSYSPQTGVFTRRGQTKPSGRIATKGYRQIALLGTRFMAHRLAWLYVHGEWPTDQIDHINQDKDDNRIDNLREVSNKQNQENVTMWSHNKSGRRGVRWHAVQRRWIAEIIQYKKKIHLGLFDTIIDAVAARIRAEREVFTHSNHYAQITHATVFQRGFEPGPGHQHKVTK